MEEKEWYRAFVPPAGVQTLVGSKKGKKIWQQAMGSRLLAHSDQVTLLPTLLALRALLIRHLTSLSGECDQVNYSFYLLDNDIWMDDFVCDPTRPMLSKGSLTEERNQGSIDVGNV
jgi:hypothetical protein